MLSRGVNAKKESFFCSAHTSTSYYVNGKALGVFHTSRRVRGRRLGGRARRNAPLEHGQKMPQAFFDSYGNLVRFPARCPPSCSHFSLLFFYSVTWP